MIGTMLLLSVLASVFAISCIADVTRGTRAHVVKAVLATLFALVLLGGTVALHLHMDAIARQAAVTDEGSQ